MSKIGYKVVWKCQEKLVSYIVGVEGVEYKIKEWVKPRHGWGALAVFNTLENAVHFAGTSSSITTSIFKCKYKPSTEKKLYNPKGVYMILEITPQGTQLAEEVMLIKSVKKLKSAYDD